MTPADGMGGRPSRRPVQRPSTASPTDPAATPRLWIEDPPGGRPRATLILAHGAGAGAEHPFLVDASNQLAARGLRVVRFEFGYMAARRSDGRRRPPSPMPRLVEDYLAATEAAPRSGALFLGGKSMGGRVACRAVEALDAATGLALLGYPFHPTGRPERLRLEEFERRGRLPVWIGQGERDPMGDRSLVESMRWDRRGIRLHWIREGDHSWSGPARAADPLAAARGAAWDDLARFCGA